MKVKNMRQALIVMMALSAILLAAGSGAWAIPLTTQYTVASTVTDLLGGNYQYSYQVTNENQTQGLDVFLIQVPENANIPEIFITNPASLGPPGYWSHYFTDTLDTRYNTSATLKPGYTWLEWDGNDPSSVYPVGTSASFSFQANAPPGLSEGIVVTYLGSANSYQGFEGIMTSPVPLPPSMLLLGSGLLGLVGLGWRRSRKEG